MERERSKIAGEHEENVAVRLTSWATKAHPIIEVNVDP